MPINLECFTQTHIVDAGNSECWASFAYLIKTILSAQHLTHKKTIFHLTKVVFLACT